MDIDLTSVIITVIALSVFFVPVVYDQVSKKNGAKKLEKYFVNLAESYKLSITQDDVWRDSYAIGIDVNSKKILHLKKQDGKNKEVLVDLSEVKTCRVAKTDRSIKTDKDRIKVTDRVELNISFINPKKQAITLELYNGRKGSVLSGEISLAEKWAGIINSNLTRNSR